MMDLFSSPVEKVIEKAGEKTETFFDKLEAAVEVNKPDTVKNAERVKDFWEGLENGNFSETNEANERADDNGQVYEMDGKLLPNMTYVLNGTTYKTDDKGRIISCECNNPKRTPENPRDTDAQTKVGGNDRKSGDQGGHVIGRDMGGDGGLGNLLPMDSRINLSDYKRMENEIKRAIDEGKDVSIKTQVIYSGDSKRPDKIITTVTIDGKDTVYTFDNNLDGSLMDKLQETCSESDIENIQSVLDETGGQVSSTKEEYDENGNLVKTTVSITYVGEDGKNYRTQVVINHNGGNSQ